MYNAQRKELFALEKEGKAVILAPKDTTDWKRTENNADKIKEMYDEGYSMGKKLIPEMQKYIGAEK